MNEPKLSRHSDRSGNGRAWRIDLAAQKSRNVDQTATVEGWLVHAPHGNHLWPWYVVSAVHLRDIEGQSKPPYKQFADATHEFLIVAIDPERYDKVSLEDFQAYHLSPVDLATQAPGLTDADAQALVVKMVDHILGGMSPDQDFRTHWVEWVSLRAKELRDLHSTVDLTTPVDRSAQMLTDGSPVPADRSHTELRPDGMQKGYVVLSDEERAKGWVRPYRDTYTHLVCGFDTTMGRSLSETYARDPKFYGATFCAICRKHFPLVEFVWKGTNEKVGS